MTFVAALISFVLAAYVQARQTIEGRVFKQPAYHMMSPGAFSDDDHKAFDFTPNDKVLLNFGQVKTFIDPATGNWRIANLDNGKYILSVDSQNVEYGHYMVEVKDNSVNYFRFNITSRERYPIKDFLSMKPLGKKQYFEVRQPFNIEGLIKSPTGIIVGITILMLFCMKNMPSQDEMKKYQQDTKKTNAEPVRQQN